jgi:putative nucleotidyltransferase with HDIG domain
MHEMVTALATIIDARDPYTAGHQSRVADLAVAIANEMDFPQHSIEGVEIAAMIHDIGKVSIPAEVLTKPGVLNSFELAMLRSHVQAGFNIVKHIHFPWPIAQIILQHHERLDGSGYPNGLSGDNILEEARIIAVADTVEAMSSNRPYRASLGIDAALQVIEDGSGVLFDEKVVKACLKLFNQNNYKFPEEKK